MLFWNCSWIVVAFLSLFALASSDDANTDRGDAQPDPYATCRYDNPFSQTAEYRKLWSPGDALRFVLE
ncbi:MAG: hypothetical protein KJO07_13125, partial [Deltaproteobacteria bacterium]|nr:hypothetical protein [Deltaproteobacteria bacterium]